MPGINK